MSSSSAASTPVPFRTPTKQHKLIKASVQLQHSWLTCSKFEHAAKVQEGSVCCYIPSSICCCVPSTCCSKVEAYLLLQVQAQQALPKPQMLKLLAHQTLQNPFVVTSASSNSVAVKLFRVGSVYITP